MTRMISLHGWEVINRDIAGKDGLVPGARTDYADGTRAPVRTIASDNQ